MDLDSLVDNDNDDMEMRGLSAVSDSSSRLLPLKSGRLCPGVAEDVFFYTYIPFRFVAGVGAPDDLNLLTIVLKASVFPSIYLSVQLLIHHGSLDSNALPVGPRRHKERGASSKCRTGWRIFGFDPSVKGAAGFVA